MAIEFARTEHIDVHPGTIGQVHRTLKGKLVAVDNGPHDVARALREIDDALRLTFNPHEDIWVVWFERKLPDGSTREELVTSCQGDECDARLVERVRRIASPDYDYAAEIERLEAASDRDNDHQRREVLGDAAEKLGHALRKDLGLKTRAFIPR